MAIRRQWLACVGICGVLLGERLCSEAPKRLVLVAGKPSHPPRMHEFNAGTQRWAKCMQSFPQVQIDVVKNGWPEDESIFDKADAIVFYMDGGEDIAIRN